MAPWLACYHVGKPVPGACVRYGVHSQRTLEKGPRQQRYCLRRTVTFAKAVTLDTCVVHAPPSSTLRSCIHTLSHPHTVPLTCTHDGVAWSTDKHGVFVQPSAVVAVLAVRKPIVGERVAIKRESGSVQGHVRFYGPTDFYQGLWVGVELDKELGKNNGTVRGRCCCCSQLGYSPCMPASWTSANASTTPHYCTFSLYVGTRRKHARAHVLLPCPDLRAKLPTAPSLPAAMWDRRRVLQLRAQPWPFRAANGSRVPGRQRQRRWRCKVRASPPPRR